MNSVISIYTILAILFHFHWFLTFFYSDVAGKNYISDENNDSGLPMVSYFNNSYFLSLFKFLIHDNNEMLMILSFLYMYI